MDRSPLLSLAIMASLAILLFLTYLIIPPWGIGLLLFLVNTIAVLLITIPILLFKPDHQETNTILRRLKRWRVETHWYAMAILVPTVIWLIALAHFVISGKLPATTPSYLKLLPLILVACYVSEAGWRGVILPRILARTSPLPASLLVGILWSACFAPVFYQDSLTMVMVIALGPVLSITSSWLFFATGESVLITALFHATFITCGLVILPISNFTLALAIALAALWGLFLVMRYGDRLLIIPQDDYTYAAPYISVTQAGHQDDLAGINNSYLLSEPVSKNPTERTS